MRPRAGMVAATVMLAHLAHARWEYDRHVVFDNSVPDGSYYRSQGMVVAPSALELVDGKLPVETSRCASPPNCLRISWRSAPGGNWQATVNATRHWGNVPFIGDTLSFWLYSDTGLSREESPRIYLVDANREGTAAISLRRGLALVTSTSSARAGSRLSTRSARWT